MDSTKRQMIESINRTNAGLKAMVDAQRNMAVTIGELQRRVSILLVVLEVLKSKGLVTEEEFEDAVKKLSVSEEDSAPNGGVEVQPVGESNDEGDVGHSEPGISRRAMHTVDQESAGDSENGGHSGLPAEVGGSPSASDPS